MSMDLDPDEVFRDDEDDPESEFFKVGFFFFLRLRLGEWEMMKEIIMSGIEVVNQPSY